MADEEDYDIGYGRPPEGKRFKPGKSGNPRGRPKGAKGLSTLATEIVSSPVEMMQNGKPVKMSALEAVLHRTKVDAIKGNKAAVDRFIRLAERFGPKDQANSPEGAELSERLQELSPFELEILALINAKVARDAPEILECQRSILKHYGQFILDLTGDEMPPLLLPAP